MNSSSSFHQSNHDVFISFRGESVRTTFVDHLESALIKYGITAFRDDELNAPWKAIEESKFAIVIFSKSYASSSRCLDKLVKIMECRKQNKLFVLPVYYYDFSPSNLRRHGSVFGELFGKYEMEKVRIWTSALVEAANLSGIGLTNYRYQEKLVKEIVEMVVNNLNFDCVNSTQITMGTKHGELRDSALSHDEPIGIKRRVQQVKLLFKVERDELTQVKIASNTALASSSLRSSRYIYNNVFICFKGHDIDNYFVDHLHNALREEGIYALSDNQELARDDSIASEHLKALEKSTIKVLILSKNYVADSCCLNELEKIMKCNEEMGQLVLPVFYDVDPSDVRKQKGLFGQSFMRNNPEKVEIWRTALVKAGSLAGWYLNSTLKRHEGAVIKSIVDLIKRKLPSSVDYNLIGIELRMKHVISLLKLESGSVHMLGMWGMEGIGKTTIARAVFDKLAACFVLSCFVENIKEVSKKYGLKHIQREVLSKLFKDENLKVRSVDEGINLIKDKLRHNKVLYVLDDVDHISQLEALVGAHNWFGQGSRIIITTTDENVLVSHGIMQIYYVKALDDQESSLFLRRHAFKKDHLTKEYEDVLPQVVSYAAGLPLALKVLSSLLCGRSKIEWTSTLARLQVFPEKAIQDTLMKSFNGLDDSQKELFLHVACFFNNIERDKVVRILDSCGFSGDDGLRLLEQKSLMSIFEGRIKMHKLFEQMGRDIVIQAHPDEPGKRSRLWHANDVSDILMDGTGTEEIVAIVVDNLHNQDAVDMTKAFGHMGKLTLLQIHSHEKSRLLPRSFYLPKGLRWVTWENFSLSSLPKSFKGKKLVGLELPGSSISIPWQGVKFLPSLLVLDFSYSRKLIETPDFTGTPNLKEVKFACCTRLIKVHESIGSLGRLVSLSLRSCKKLKTLPQSILKLKSLKHLDISGCLNLKLFRLMDYLLEFRSDTRMFKVPSTTIVKLVLIDFRNLCLLPGLKLERSFSFHARLLDIMGECWPSQSEQHNILGSTTDHSLLSESETSQELIEYKKE